MQPYQSSFAASWLLSIAMQGHGIHPVQDGRKTAVLQRREEGAAEQRSHQGERESLTHDSFWRPAGWAGYMDAVMPVAVAVV